MFPIYSSYFTGNTPFHHTVAALMSAGAAVLPNNVATNYWAQAMGSSQPYNSATGRSPIFLALPINPVAAFGCPEYGGCPAAGLKVNVPTTYAPSVGEDHHGTIFDPVTLKGEVDGWGGYGCSKNLTNGTIVNPSSAGCAHPCDYEPQTNGGILNCAFGGFAPFSGNGLGANGNAGGYAFGLITITAQELLQGHIDHALGIVSSCLDNNGVYPARVGRSTDTACPANEEPNAVYGDMIHLKASVNVASLGASRYCSTILTAFQTYGAYTDDTNGGSGLALDSEVVDGNPLFAITDPWSLTILPVMAGAGEASGLGTSYANYNCLKYVNAGMIEAIQISSNLP